MIQDTLIEEVVDSQWGHFLKKKLGVQREKESDVVMVDNFVQVITGVRRSGKSTLLLQLLKKHNKNVLFLNFEDIRLAGFENDDFRRLDKVITRKKANTLFFDEIQELVNWELYVRQKLDEGFKVVVTGSNASLMSTELGTKLTGRHMTTEVFPFSYHEFLAFKKLKSNVSSAQKYLEMGGFPEFLKVGHNNMLMQLLDDILYKDIAVRYGVRDITSLRRLVVYLITNIGKPVSATNLKKLFDVKATSTLLEYFSHLENAYIVQFIPMFSYSLKKQIRNAKKVYAIDLGMHQQVSTSFSEDWGRRLENLVYLQLRRKFKEIYYFSEEKECDFIVMEKERPRWIVQVCHELNMDNQDIEINGALAALDFFDQKEATLVTLNQEDQFNVRGKTIHCVPLYKFLEETK